MELGENLGTAPAAAISSELMVGDTYTDSAMFGSISLTASSCIPIKACGHRKTGLRARNPWRGQYQCPGFDPPGAILFTKRRFLRAPF